MGRYLLIVLLALGIGRAEAALTINSVVLTNTVTGTSGAVITVAPGATITAAVNETSTAGTNWRATQWRIATTPPGALTCEDTVDHTTSGTFTESLAVTAPAVAGTYNAYFVARANAACTGASSATFTMTGAVIVDA